MGRRWENDSAWSSRVLLDLSSYSGWAYKSSFKKPFASFFLPPSRNPQFYFTSVMFRSGKDNHRMQIFHNM